MAAIEIIKPYTNKLRGRANKRKNINSEDEAKRFDRMSIDVNETAEVKPPVSNLYGLKTEVMDYVERCQGICSEHQTRLYYIKRWFENREGDCHGTSIKQRLQYLGFTEEMASELETRFNQNKMFEHQNLTYWVNVYVEYVFEIEMSPPKHLADSPEKIIYDQWKEVDIKPKKHNNAFTIQTIYITKNDDAPIWKTGDDEFQLSEKRGSFWYHGTSKDSALKIIESGIKHNEGNLKQDFSSGTAFYLNYSYTEAKEFSKKKSSCTSERTAAVLIFKFDVKDEESKFRLLDLEQEKNKRKWWKKTIAQFRNGEDISDDELTEEIDNADCILGPMSSESQNRTMIKDTTQLCLKTMRIKNVVSMQLKGIVYLTDGKKSKRKK